MRKNPNIEDIGKSSARFTETDHRCIPGKLAGRCGIHEDTEITGISVSLCCDED